MLPVPSAVRQTFSVQNAVNNGVWGLIYLALDALFLALGRRVLALGWVSALLIALAAFCLLFAVTLFLRRNSASKTRAVLPPELPDDRPVSIRIDRDPVWHNFNYQAYIAEVHVVVTNQTDAEIEIAGHSWLFEFGGIVSTIEIAREVERYKRQRPQFGRHSVIEPGATESGWAVVAAAYNAGQPELPTLKVKVSGYPEFEARR